MRRVLAGLRALQEHWFTQGSSSRYYICMSFVCQIFIWSIVVKYVNVYVKCIKMWTALGWRAGLERDSCTNGAPCLSSTPNTHQFIQPPLDSADSSEACLMPISMRDSNLHPPLSQHKDIWTIVKDVTISVIADISHGALQKKESKVTLAWANTVWVVSGNMYEKVISWCVFEMNSPLRKKKQSLNLIVVLLFCHFGLINAVILQCWLVCRDWWLVEIPCFRTFNINLHCYIYTLGV